MTVILYAFFFHLRYPAFLLGSSGKALRAWDVCRSRDFDRLIVRWGPSDCDADINGQVAYVSSWFVVETVVKMRDKWTYPSPAIDCDGQKFHFKISEYRVWPQHDALSNKKSEQAAFPIRSSSTEQAQLASLTSI